MNTSVKSIAPTGRIGEELPCAKCGYNLRGATVAGVCAECGEAVRTTLAGRALHDPDYARTGLQDYGTSLKFAFLALIGLPALPILGPLAAVVIVGAGFVRVSSLMRLRHSGLATSSGLRLHCRSALVLAWIAAVWGTCTTVLFLHDALNRWPPWLSPNLSIALAYIWIALVAAEMVAAILVLHRAAAILEVGWLTFLTRISALLVIGGLIVNLLLILVGALLTPGGAGAGALVAALVLFVWLPVIIGGWGVASSLQQLAGIATELNWLASGGAVTVDEPSGDFEIVPETRRPKRTGDDDAPIPLD